MHPSGDPAELELLLCRFEEKAKASSSVSGSQLYEFLGHDLRMTLHRKHGDTDAADAELEVFSKPQHGLLVAAREIALRSISRTVLEGIEELPRGGPIQDS